MIRTERQELLRCLTSWSIIPEVIKGENGQKFMQHARLLFNCQKTGKMVFGRRAGFKLEVGRLHIQTAIDDKHRDGYTAERNATLDDEFLRETYEVLGVRPDAVKSLRHVKDGIEIVIQPSSINYYGRGVFPYPKR